MYNNANSFRTYMGLPMEIASPLEEPMVEHPKAKMKTLFVFIALVVMHLRAMMSLFVGVHIMPQLDGINCA